jgi:hypothetical protein
MICEALALRLPRGARAGRRHRHSRLRLQAGGSGLGCLLFRVDPARVLGGRYQLPTAPGYSVTMKPSSIAEFSFPAGPAWR